MRGAYAITDPRLGASGVIPAGAVVIMDGIIRETGPFDAIAPKYPGANILGDGTQLLLPGLVDAHSHRRGLSPIQKGVRNDSLENALFDWAYMPTLPPELTAAICALRHLGGGCTLLHHNGFDDDGAEGARRAHIAIRTYLNPALRHEVLTKSFNDSEAAAFVEATKAVGARYSTSVIVVVVGAPTSPCGRIITRRRIVRRGGWVVAVRVIIRIIVGVGVR